MKVARKYQILLAVFSAILAVAVACSKNSIVEEQNPQGGDEVEPKGLPVSLAFGMKDVNYSPATKTLEDVAQVAGTPASFRGMSDIWFLPFEVQREIHADDSRMGDYLALPYAGIDKTFGDDASSGTFHGLVNSNNSHYYKNVYIPSGAASFLVYGKAAETSPITIGGITYTQGTQQYKHLYGSLIAEDAAPQTKASDITFSPEAIADATAKAAIVSKAQRLANYMTTLFTTSYSVNYQYRTGSGWGAQPVTANVSKTWMQAVSENPDWCSQTMKDWYNTLLNGGGSGTQGNIYSGSGTSITNLLTRLYIALSAEDNTVSNNYWNPNSSYNCYLDYSNSTRLTYRNFSKSYRDKILDQIKSFANVTGTGNNITLTLKDADLSDFPVSDGLPEGCVAIQWDGAKFTAVSEGSYDIHLAPMDRFCYPPSLWYFVNSQISVAKKLGSEPSEVEAERNVAAYYKNTSATWTSILNQYNTGERRLGPVVKKGAVSVAVNDPMQYGVALLKLNLNTTAATLDDASSPAINVNVNNSNFPMTAVIVAGQHKQSFDFSPLTGNEFYVYDNMPLSSTGGTRSWITSLANTNNPSYTLLLQSLQAEDVIICVEFQNNSTTTFKGETGYIVPGSKFYMLGTIVYNDGTGDKNLVKSVFQQDYVTEVTLSINSLKHAFNCIPDLQDPQLEVGVEINVDWLLATPTNVPLY